MSRAYLTAVLLAAFLAAAASASADPQREGAEPVDTAAWSRELPGVNREADSLAGLAGELTVVHFWADWCGPCKEELPELETFYREHYPALRAQGVRLVTVSNDFSEGSARKVISRYDLSMPVYFDPKQRLTRDLGKTRALPLTVVIDADRHVKLVNLGPMEWTAAALERALGGFAAGGT